MSPPTPESSPRADRGPRSASPEPYPIVVAPDTTGRWTAWVAIHDAASEDELMDWLNRNVPVEWTGRGVGWAYPPARPPRRDG